MCIVLALATAAVISCVAFLYAYFPRKYNAEIAAACREFGVEENLVRGVIHTESKFRPKARSQAGAVGLMQLMPATAVWLADRLHEPTLALDLTHAPSNIRLGVSYLAYLLQKYPLRDALAAYNAGEGNLLKWRAEGRESYGFAETRSYVKKVLRAKKIYGML